MKTKQKKAEGSDEEEGIPLDQLSEANLSIDADADAVPTQRIVINKTVCFFTSLLLKLIQYVGSTNTRSRNNPIRSYLAMVRNTCMSLPGES